MSLSQYDGWTVEEIVARNSHELTALHLLNARAYIVEQREASGFEVRRLLGLLDETRRIGMRVLMAQKAGRKTLRIADLIEDDE